MICRPVNVDFAALDRLAGCKGNRTIKGIYAGTSMAD